MHLHGYSVYSRQASKLGATNRVDTNNTVAVVGLGYVGLPLALAFGNKLPTIGFDISESKIAAYRDGIDPTGEMSTEAFQQADKIRFTNDPQDLSSAAFIVVAVPTPIDDANQPDLTPLIKASELVGQYLAPNTTVIFESTVYPGATEEVCGPILQKVSGLSREQFKLAYSPERINPGDKDHTLSSIVKVVSGQDEATLASVAQLYETVIDAGVYQASSIKVAEAAKVIENTQRDVNISLINELSIIFNRLGIDTSEVLKAAGTKWNFLPFKPGLVGGHCIGVDPYYLTYKAQQLGYHPEVILSGRRINDGMGKYVAEQTIKQLIASDKPVRGANVLLLGITFKENCADIRNTKVVDIISELQSYGVTVHVADPVADAQEVEAEYNIQLQNWQDLNDISAVVAAVAHTDIVNIDLAQLAEKSGKGVPFIDIKSMFDKKQLTQLGFKVWRL